MSLAADASAPSIARRRLRQTLAGVPAQVVDDVLLLATELLTNSVRHAGAGAKGRIELVVSATARVLRIVVSDPGTGSPFGYRAVDPMDTNGRGLLLVSELASRWGVERGRSTSVWFEMRLAGAS